jgi:hypothetical protein
MTFIHFGNNVTFELWSLIRLGYTNAGDISWNNATRTLTIYRMNINGESDKSYILKKVIPVNATVILNNDNTFYQDLKYLDK